MSNARSDKSHFILFAYPFLSVSVPIEITKQEEEGTSASLFRIAKQLYIMASPAAGSTGFRSLLSWIPLATPGKALSTAAFLPLLIIQFLVTSVWARLVLTAICIIVYGMLDQSSKNGKVIAFTFPYYPFY